MTDYPSANSYPPSPPRRRRARRLTVLHVMAGLLASVVALNVCLVIVFGGYYWYSRTSAIAANETPPEPMEVLQTVIPGVPDLDPTPSATIPPPTGIVNILLLGKDQRADETGMATRTDTMMVLRVDFDRQTAKLLSFPRDVWVALPNLHQYGISEGRINTAYYYGEIYQLPGGGAKAAMDTVTLNFGIPIHHYALINFDGFVKVVDSLGGIEIDVPKRIYDEQYPTDDYGTMVLIIESGLQHMDGETALRYARTRHQDSDTERIKRQQAVLLAIRDKAVSVNAVARLPELYDALQGTFETDMSLPIMIAYGVIGQQIDRSQIQTFAIDQTMLAGWVTPGGAHVWIPQRANIAPVVNAFLAVP